MGLSHMRHGTGSHESSFGGQSAQQLSGQRSNSSAMPLRKAGLGAIWLAESSGQVCCVPKARWSDWVVAQQLCAARHSATELEALSY